MDLPTLLYLFIQQPIALILLFLTTLLSYRLLTSRSTRAPWATTPIPLLGGAIAYGTDPVNFLVEQRRKLGDVFRVNLLVMKMTFVVGGKWQRWLLREVGESDGMSFWKAILDMHLGLLNTSFYHPGWVERANKALQTGMNRPARLEKYAEQFTKVAEDLYEQWSAAEKIPLFLSGSDLLLRANMTALYGSAFVAKHADELIPVVRRFERSFTNPLVRALPLWASKPGRELRRCYERMKVIIDEEVQMRVGDKQYWGQQDDYMSYLLTMDDKVEGFFDCYGEHLMIMISASHVNTAGTFSWTLLHLLRTPGLLSQYQDEIRSNPPSDSGVYPAKNMPFSEACMRETGRLYTNLVLIRYAEKDLVGPDGTVVPKGWVAASPLATQRDPELYPQPDQWIPARFLPDKSGKSDYANNFRNNEFVQFGYGKHACLGEKLTHILLRSSLWPALLDSYDVEIVDELEEGEGIDGVGVEANWRENMGTPFAVREVWVRLKKRERKLTEAGGQTIVEEKRNDLLSVDTTGF